jgi:chloramphenicol-sensitive protein RarD
MSLAYATGSEPCPTRSVFATTIRRNHESRRRPINVSKSSSETRTGLFYGLAAYGTWGLMPLYFGAVGGVTPLEILAHRIVWSVCILAVLLTLLRRWSDLVRALRTGSIIRLLMVSAVLLSLNWLAYIYGVWTQRVMENSLGYFINPLFTVLLGVLFFRERLCRWQWFALGLATVGSGYLIYTVGEVPWIALAIAGTFGLYGLVRKIVPLDGLVGVAIEMMLLAPAALAGIGHSLVSGWAVFRNQSASTDGLLLLSGVVTMIPLLCFGQAVRRLPLSTLGFLQYLAPSMQFLLALWVFHEPFAPARQISFACIWTALLIFTIDALLAHRRKRAENKLQLAMLRGGVRGERVSAKHR